MSVALRSSCTPHSALASHRRVVAFCVILFGMGLPSALLARESVRLQFLYSIRVPQEHQAVLEDVSAKGLVLLNATGDMFSDLSDFRHPKLLLWNPSSRTMPSEIPLPECVKRRVVAGAVSQRGRLGPFRFVADGSLIVGIQNPWLFLIDTENKAEVAHVMPSPALPSAVSTSAIGSRKAILTVSPRRRRVAVVLNNRTQPHLFMYRADLRGQATSWQLGGSVQDLSWSPDGKALAVLYSGVRDPQGNYISRWDRKPGLRTLPNVEILDARTGRSLLEFNTGDVGAKVEFSRDGKGLYVIPEGLCAECKDVKRDALLVFSASDGRLERTFRVAGTGVRDSFELSPDGQLLAASASSAWKLLGFTAEASWTKSDGRFVLMDAEDGQILFKHHERTWNRGAPFRFAFSPDGELLFADPDCNLHCPGGERVEVYSIEKSH